MTMYKVGDRVRTVGRVTGYPEIDTGTVATVTDAYPSSIVIRVQTDDGVQFSIYDSEVEKVGRFAVGDKVVTSNAPSLLRFALRDLGVVINGDGEFERIVSRVDADNSLITFEYFSQDIWFDSQYFEVVKKPRVFEVGDLLTQGEMLDLPHGSVVVSKRSGISYLIKSVTQNVVYMVNAFGDETLLSNNGFGTYTVLHLGESL